jgi:hypothetical protein
MSRVSAKQQRRRRLGDWLAYTTRTAYLPRVVLPAGVPRRGWLIVWTGGRMIRFHETSGNSPNDPLIP